MLAPIFAVTSALALILAAGEPPASTPAPAPAKTPATAPAKPAEPTKTAEPAKADPYILTGTVKSIDGKDVNLADYKGKVVMIVNVATKCGLTKDHYPALQKLYTEKKDAGFVILAFPANNFKDQEPGTDKEIAEYCANTQHVTFPIFSKISVKGADQAPLYKKITSNPKPVGEEPTWNFTKYLVDRDGKLVARFEPKTMPSDKSVTEKIDELLKAKPAAAK